MQEFLIIPELKLKIFIDFFNTLSSFYYHFCIVKMLQKLSVDRPIMKIVCEVHNLK